MRGLTIDAHGGLEQLRYRDDLAVPALDAPGSVRVRLRAAALNRLDVSVIAFNWDKPWSVRYVPSWMEVWVSITLVTIGVLLFRWIVNRMPILRESPDFAERR